jgi:cell division protease FtsH
MTRQEMKSRLAIMFGGRVAEELIFGDDNVTSGAASDIEQATKLARAMVMRWGLSELGPIAFGENQEEVFLGHSVAKNQNMSEETARAVDEEIRKIIEEAYDEANRILTERIDDLHAIANALLEYETLSGEEIDMVLRGETIDRPDVGQEIPPPSAVTSSVPQAGKAKGAGGDESEGGGFTDPEPQGA